MGAKGMASSVSIDWQKKEILTVQNNTDPKKPLGFVGCPGGKMKEEETLGFPYSEMFRRFANAIQQPQNVLIIYGYGFGDEHINRVIFNALSISTFQLIVISYGWTPNLEEFYKKVQDDSRVSFLIGKYLGDWENFVLELLPDIKQFEFEQNILATMKKLKQNVKEEVVDSGK